MLPQYARQQHKDSGHAEAKETPEFGGACGPMKETDKETILGQL